jgi:hypothetical protein
VWHSWIELFGGSLLLGQPGERFIRAISLDFFFFDPAVIQRQMESAVLRIEEVIERGPYAPEVEYQSRRAYIFVRKPDPASSSYS